MYKLDNTIDLIIGLRHLHHIGYEPHERSVTVEIALANNEGAVLDDDAPKGKENAKQLNLITEGKVTILK
jgi:hypothetical protein